MGQIIIKEQIIPDTPPTDYHAVFVDVADGVVKKKNDAGVVSSLEPPVVSVFGRVGAVVSSSGDYTASEITNVPAGNISASTVQAAIAELDTEKAPITHVGSNGVSQHSIASGSNAGFLSTSDFTKLSGIEPGATANSSDATLLARANHTGTQTASTISDFNSAADSRASAAIASHVGDSDPHTQYALDSDVTSATAYSVARANHTGTQLAATISDFDSASDARVAIHGALTNNPHAVTKAQVGLGSVDNTSDSSKPVSTAQAAADTAVQNFAIQRSNHTGTQPSSTISDFQEAAQDATSAALASGTHDGISFTYNDAGDSISATNTNKGSTAVAAHEALSGPHPQYTTEAEAIVIALVFG
jgi:hypothetical protein